MADCFRYRNKIGPDVALVAVRDARNAERIACDEIWPYANICRVANV